jgi:hypothetical protein
LIFDHGFEGARRKGAMFLDAAWALGYGVTMA